jgi:dTDP-4-dehydrorhamnose 3,5-epimerase
MRILATAAPGLARLLADPIRDERGAFVKTFEESVFAAAGLATAFPEEFHTVSGPEVVRGLHFQVPPDAQAKVVFCLGGEILDAVVDLRVGSPSYREAFAFTLTANGGEGLYIPEGFAHGFCALGEGAVVSYRVSAAYAPSNDRGVRWDSAGIDWPVADPVMSERDRSFPALDAFDSPFRFEEAGRG